MRQGFNNFDTSGNADVPRTAVVPSLTKHDLEALKFGPEANKDQIRAWTKNVDRDNRTAEVCSRLRTFGNRRRKQSFYHFDELLSRS